ncbi:hypothetical protein NQ176_g5589 [Zarea fungicola]|uniref:Uncharacterized protein n=1 Tax=Zarea fungicola TaxID=93591 RepID=A0ACC1N9Z8_9HYPO|nr:hypothetical protein NQ176_g5589 [Lecanicillium fungicola]
MSKDSSQPPASLASWVDDAFEKIFFQSDNEVSTEAFGKFISPSFSARININKLTHAQFLSAVKSAREEFTFTRESSVETLTWEKSDGSGAGSVAQVGKFLQVNKQNGESTRVTSVTVATVGIEDGQRVLLELAEISKEC